MEGPWGVIRLEGGIPPGLCDGEGEQTGMVILVMGEIKNFQSNFLSGALFVECNFFVRVSFAFVYACVTSNTVITKALEAQYNIWHIGPSEALSKRNGAEVAGTHPFLSNHYIAAKENS